MYLRFGAHPDLPIPETKGFRYGKYRLVYVDAILIWPPLEALVQPKMGNSGESDQN